jgi:hypothetical protein
LLSVLSTISSLEQTNIRRMSSIRHEFGICF